MRRKPPRFPPHRTPYRSDPTVEEVVRSVGKPFKQINVGFRFFLLHENFVEIEIERGREKIMRLEVLGGKLQRG